MRFVKGHGTENDFVVLPDLDARLDLADSLVRAICDRRAGLGADGVLRVVPTAAVPEVAHLAARATYFMDHRNADGSLAEMCGNGVRVFGRYLVAAGLSHPGRLPIATRGGVRVVDVPPDGPVRVGMGVPRLLGDQFTVELLGCVRAGTGVSMGNPHVVVAVADLDEFPNPLPSPRVGPSSDLPAGTNVEFVVAAGPGHIALRVHERGVGETRSCGTGACAAAVAAARWWGGPVDHDVDVPGGRLHITAADDGELIMTGPAVLVAEGDLRVQELSAAVLA